MITIYIKGYYIIIVIIMRFIFINLSYQIVQENNIIIKILIILIVFLTLKKKFIFKYNYMIINPLQTK